MYINCFFLHKIYFSISLSGLQHGNKPRFAISVFFVVAKLMFVLTYVCIQVFKLFAEIFQPNRYCCLWLTTNQLFYDNFRYLVLIIGLFRTSILPEETRGHPSCGRYRHHSFLSGKSPGWNPVNHHLHGILCQTDIFIQLWPTFY